MASNTYSVTASKLNVRSGPSTNYSVVGTLNNGDIVTVLGNSNGFANIGTNKWVSSNYLKKVEVKATNGTVEGSVKVSEKGRPTFFLQGDSRWGSIMYSSVGDKTQTIKTSGCGPTCAAMLVNAYVDKTYSPVECCEWANAQGYRTSNNGSAWAMFKAIAVKFGFKFLQTASLETAKKFMNENPNAHTVCIMSKGNWTTGGHYILVWKMDDKYVYVNDPASTAAARLKNTQTLLASQCRQYFCFSYGSDSPTEWAEKNTITTVNSEKYAVSASKLTVRSIYNTTGVILGYLSEGNLVTATKKCGDWYYVTSSDGKLTGWVAGNYLEAATLDNVNSGLASDTKNAINYLVSIKFMDSPDWWKKNVFNYDCATYLLIKIADRIKAEEDQIDNKTFKFEVSRVAPAVDHLTEIGLITSPDLWKKQCVTNNKLNNIGFLLIKAANYID